MQEVLTRGIHIMEEQGSIEDVELKKGSIDTESKPNLFSSRMRAFYTAGARTLVHLMYNIEMEGFDKIPDDGPAIVICNHVAYVDGLIINAAIKNRNVRFIIDRDIYQWPGVNYFMKINQAIPIAPNKKEVAAALDSIAEGLEKGDIICIFPEGQMTYTGNMGRFKPGVEWMISRTPVPVYPMALKGVWGSIFSRKYRKARFKFIPRGLWSRVHIKCGDPIAPEKVKVNYLQKRVSEILQEM